MLVAKAINVRLDAEAERALKTIQRLDGLSTSEAVRKALIEAEQKHFSAEELRKAWKRSWEDPAYVREVEELLKLQDDIWERIPE